MATGRILLVESAQPVLATLAPTLEAAGYAVGRAGSAARALAEVGERDYDLALVTFRPPDMDGPSLVAALRQKRPELVVVLLAAEPDRAEAFAARGDGVRDFLEIPQDLSRERILTVVMNALEHQRLCREVETTRAAPATLDLAQRERQAILAALEATRWNKQAAARLLGLHRPTLYAKLQKHGIPQRRPA